MAFSLYSVLIVAFFAASLDNCSALSDETKAEIAEKLKAHATACATENGITITADTLKEFKEQNKQIDDTNKCFFACMFKKTGMIDDQGLYSEEATLQKLSQYDDGTKVDKLKEAAKTCASVNQETVSDGAAGCDRAKLLFACIIQQKELFGFVV